MLEAALQEIREELGAIVDSEGNPIQPGEVERAIAYLLRSRLEDCQFRYEIQEWLDDRLISKQSQSTQNDQYGRSFMPNDTDRQCNISCKIDCD